MASPPAWQRRLEARWELSRRGVPFPKEAPAGSSAPLDPKPFERNLLQSPNPEGVNISEPAPPCPLGAPRKPLDSEGNFKGWQISVEPLDSAEGAPSRFTSPRYSWCVKQQWIDLLAEGLWEELLDFYQPNITIMDWYENSGLASSVYELHARLLGSDKAKVISEFQYVDGEGGQDERNEHWMPVSHVFRHYGPGARHVHFLHKTKDVQTPAGFLRTRVTDSSVSVQLRD